jgi:hypothetical protein
MNCQLVVGAFRYGRRGCPHSPGRRAGVCPRSARGRSLAGRSVTPLAAHARAFCCPPWRRSKAPGRCRARGRRLQLGLDPIRHGLRPVRHPCLVACNRGLTDQGVDAQGVAVGRPRDGALDPDGGGWGANDVAAVAAVCRASNRVGLRCQGGLSAAGEVACTPPLAQVAGALDRAQSEVNAIVTRRLVVRCALVPLERKRAPKSPEWLLDWATHSTYQPVR